MLLIWSLEAPLWQYFMWLVVKVAVQDALRLHESSVRSPVEKVQTKKSRKKEMQLTKSALGKKFD